MAIAVAAAYVVTIPSQPTTPTPAKPIIAQQQLPTPTAIPVRPNIVNVQPTSTTAPRVISTAVVPSQPVMQPSPTPRIVSTIVIPSQPTPTTTSRAESSSAFDRAVADLTAVAQVPSVPQPNGRVTEQNLYGSWKMEGRCVNKSVWEEDGFANLKQLMFTPDRKLRSEDFSIIMTYEILPDGRLEMAIAGMGTRVLFQPSLSGNRLTLTGKGLFFISGSEKLPVINCTYVRL